jgi:hypothetical protein
MKNSEVIAKKGRIIHLNKSGSIALCKWLSKLHLRKLASFLALARVTFMDFEACLVVQGAYI